MFEYLLKILLCIPLCFIEVSHGWLKQLLGIRFYYILKKFGVLIHVNFWKCYPVIHFHYLYIVMSIQAEVVFSSLAVDMSWLAQLFLVRYYSVTLTTYFNIHLCFFSPQIISKELNWFRTWGLKLLRLKSKWLLMESMSSHQVLQSSLYIFTCRSVKVIIAPLILVCWFSVIYML